MLSPLDLARAAGLYDSIGQAFVVLLPCKSVGVMGDGRTYENACAVRCVQVRARALCGRERKIARGCDGPLRVQAAPRPGAQD
jgi:hypothetical protein